MTINLVLYSATTTIDTDVTIGCFVLLLNLVVSLYFAGLVLEGDNCTSSDNDTHGQDSPAAAAGWFAVSCPLTCVQSGGV